MNDLISQIVARCDALTAGQLFDNSSGGASVEVVTFAHALPIAATPEYHDEMVPYVVVRLMGMEESHNKINPLVRVIGEIYTADGVADGMADLLRLVDCLRPLVERGPGNLAGYKIIPPVVWQLGDKDAGNQPHPFYQFQADLRIAGV